jgi:hypothetical protein
MYGRPRFRAISASTREATLAAVVVLLAAWAGLSWTGSDDPAPPPGPAYGAGMESGSGPCDANGTSNVALRLVTTEEAPLVLEPARLIVRWEDAGDTGPLACVEPDDDDVTADATTAQAPAGERAAQITVTGMERGQDVSVNLGVEWPADATVTSVPIRVETDPAADGTVAIDARPVAVEVNHLEPPSVAAQLVGPPDGAVLGEPASYELRVTVRDGPAHDVTARLPLASGVTVERLSADNDGDCAPDAEAVVCHWAELEESASARMELVIVPGDPTCEFLVLCLEVEVTWSDDPDAVATASTEVDLEGRRELVIASYSVDGIRVFTISNTSTGRVTEVLVDDPGCGPVTSTDPPVIEPGATLVLTCGGSTPEEREVTSSALGPSGQIVTGSLVIEGTD